MNIPTAEEARKILTAAKYAKAEKQLAQIEKSINEAINEGKCSVSGDGHLEFGVKSKLTELGYQCHEGTDRNESYWSISW